MGRVECLGVCTRLLGEATTGKEGWYGALRRRDWEHMGRRRDHFRGMGELECKVQLSITTRERLKMETCRAALLPKVGHVGELV